MPCHICNTPSKPSEGTITCQGLSAQPLDPRTCLLFTSGIEQQFCRQHLGECLYSSLGRMKCAADSVLYCLYFSSWLKDSFPPNHSYLVEIFCISQTLGLEKQECYSTAFFLFDLWPLLDRHDHLKAVSLPKMCRAVERCLSSTFFNIKFSRKSLEGSEFARSR